MVLGNPEEWAQHVISLDERILQRIVFVWKQCVAPLGKQPTEDQVTINLVHWLGKDEVVRRICYWIEYQFEPFGTNAAGAKFSKGKIDMAVLLDWERHSYLAYECKRLNVVHRGKRSSLATEYVVNGMMRFLTEQYAEQLPMGAVLGYVMDGDISFAESCVHAAIKAHGELALSVGPTSIPNDAGLTRFQTMHTRASMQSIELRHSLLSHI